MSAGPFQNARYEASYANNRIHPIRVQPETLAANANGIANESPVADLSNPISAVLSLNRGQLGLRPRYVTLKAPAVNPPAGYQPGGVTRIPALTDIFWDACTRDAEVDYLGVTFRVVSRESERAR